MSRRRVLFATLAVIVAVIGLWAMVSDVTFEDRTCGNALIATDPSRLVILSGDPAVDDFEGQRLEGSCHRRIQQRRFLVMVPFGVSVWAAVLSARSDARRPRR